MKIIELEEGDVLSSGDVIVHLCDGELLAVPLRLIGQVVCNKLSTRHYRIITDTEPVKEESEHFIHYTAPGVRVSIDKCANGHDAAAFIGAIAVMLHDAAENSVDTEGD